MDGFGLLDPVVQHHIVNTLGWTGLRPLQNEATGPVVAGEDAVLLAPTAGGKTEAAMFPLLTRMQGQRWDGVSVLYLCPLRALLNNLQPRLDEYASWLGRSARTWHGDVNQSARQRIQRERPDILLTTPESLESMLVSERVDAAALLGGLHAVVVDEVHAFAGDDRGWHLRAVLARIEDLLGRRLQRIGMSATVGNPAVLLTWLQGGHTGPGRVIAPADPAATKVPEVTVDSVGSIQNAATVIAALHAGEKRLVFVDSRRLAEELAAGLRERGITTFVSHSSLSPAERRESEQAFAESRDCVIVATSTLELGIDVGDLDRVIQINAPRTVSSFLQRLGRTGRRPGAVRNCLFLGITDDALLATLGMLKCWSDGWVEPVTPPPEPRHIAAQQLLAAALQTRRLPLQGWDSQWTPLPLFGDDGPEIFDYLVSEGFLDHDSGTAFIGPEAEKRFGRRHFMELLAVFTAPPVFTVLAGRHEVGSVEASVLTDVVEGPRVLLLAGRSWKVTHIDWLRRRVYVEATDIAGRAKWMSLPDGTSLQITRAARDVLLGSAPDGVTLTRRAEVTLADMREQHSGHVDPARFVVERDRTGTVRWWTWAGVKANRTIAAATPIAVPRQRPNAEFIRLHSDLTVQEIQTALAELSALPEWPLPTIDPGALNGLKFSTALPPDLAARTLGARALDEVGASDTVGHPAVFHLMS